MRYSNLLNVFSIIFLSITLIGCGQQNSDSSDDQMNSGIPASMNEGDYPSDDTAKAVIYDFVMQGMKVGEKNRTDRLGYYWEGCAFDSYVVGGKKDGVKIKRSDKIINDAGNPVAVVTAEVTIDCKDKGYGSGSTEYLIETTYMIYNLNSNTEPYWELHIEERLGKRITG